MPYIRPDLRQHLDPLIEPLKAEVREGGPGVLNYVITKLLIGMEASSYSGHNEIIGALECAKQEYYRKVLVPYEDQKCKENGEVY